jgi:urease accessory protein
MTWHAHLHLDYTLQSQRTVARYTHQGPLRILQSLYPEGADICHNVLVHPPGGLVGGDTLQVTVDAASGTHALLTTPGATRFYRSAGATARQITQLRLQADARLEWLPLETLCYRASEAENHLSLTLEPGAQCLGWDVTALGWMPDPAHVAQATPSANTVHAAHAPDPTDAAPPAASGRLLQHLEIPGVWLERGTIAAADQHLLHSPLGLAGHGCLASVFFASGTALTPAQRETALDAARAVIAPHPLAPTAGATSPHPQLLLARMLAPQVEPAMALARALRAAWRTHFWQLPATAPRVWAL